VIPLRFLPDFKNHFVHGYKEASLASLGFLRFVKGHVLQPGLKSV
jgi:hypothetical protein